MVYRLLQIGLVGNLIREVNTTIYIKARLPITSNRISWKLLPVDPSLRLVASLPITSNRISWKQPVLEVLRDLD